MERGTVSQIAEAPCVVGKVTDPNRHDPDQSFLCRLVCMYQTRNAQEYDEIESLCPEDETVCERTSDSIRNVT